MLNRHISPLFAAFVSTLVSAGVMAAFTSLAVLPWLRANTAGLSQEQLLERALGITWMPALLLVIASSAFLIRWVVENNSRVADACRTLTGFPPPPARRELARSQANSESIRALYGRPAI
jgi:hypothetical protein